VTIGRGASPPDRFPDFPANCRSLLVKHLTVHVWNQLKDRKTGLGVGLEDCIRSGVANLDSEIGVYAGDAESYVVYAPLFEPVIADCHPDFAAAGPQRRHALEAATFRPVNPDPDGRYIASTRVRLARNFTGYRLRAMSTADEDRDIEQKAKIAFGFFTGELAGFYRPMAEVAETGRARAADDHVFERGDRFQDAAGFNRRWPIGRGVFCNEARSFFSWVNEEDHLRLISIQPNADIAGVFARLCKAMAIIDQCLELQHSERLGYVASCPSNLGTGLRASFHIKLPLSGASDPFREICARHGLAARSHAGEGSPVSKHLYDISNKHRLGRSEIQYLQDCVEGARKLIDLEKSFEAKAATAIH
jgi:protein-arginine kinase